MTTNHEFVEIKAQLAKCFQYRGALRRQHILALELYLQTLLQSHEVLTHQRTRVELSQKDGMIELLKRSNEAYRLRAVAFSNRIGLLRAEVALLENKLRETQEGPEE